MALNPLTGTQLALGGGARLGLNPTRGRTGGGTTSPIVPSGPAVSPQIGGTFRILGGGGGALPAALLNPATLFQSNPAGSPFLSGSSPGPGATVLPPRARVPSTGALPTAPSGTTSPAASAGRGWGGWVGGPSGGWSGNPFTPGVLAGVNRLQQLQQQLAGGAVYDEGGGRTGINPFPFTQSFNPQNQQQLGLALGMAQMLGNDDLSFNDFANIARDLQPGGSLANQGMSTLLGGF